MHPVKVRAGRFLVSRAAFITSSMRRKHSRPSSTVSRIKSHPLRSFSSVSLSSKTNTGIFTKAFSQVLGSAPVLAQSTGEMVRLPDHRLLARAFYRGADKGMGMRAFSGSGGERKKEGEGKGETGYGKEHVLEEGDKHNVQHDASREGKEERAKGNGSRGTSEGSGGSNKKAREEFPEAPDTIGMQDERGGKN